MADNVEITAGAGTVIAADDAAGVMYQRVKLINSTVDSTTPTGVAADPLVIGGAVAHDAADSGNPLKVGGTAISDLAGATMVAAADRTDLRAGLDGVLLVRPYATIANSLVERVSNTDGAATALTVFGATADAKNCITTIAVYNAHASTNGYIDFRDGTGGTVIFTIPLPAGGGAVVSFPHPMVQPTANTALAFDVSAAITTIYISVVGFKSKA
jgi:hypothetical protein